MFYKIIRKKRDQWLASGNCPVKALLQYMLSVGFMRDAQTDAIKTYLFLKIVGRNRPLAELVSRGFFNTLQLDELEISTRVRQYLADNPAAAALYEYASTTDNSGKIFAPKIVETIKKSPESIDYAAFFRKMFYNVSYTDYLFSLPMGAGKTYLMAAFIYLDLYFAKNEPDNPVFAHNFIIFAPSGLKSSVIPSLRTIQNFDPSRIIPEPAASALKRELIFEVLDQNKTASKSNKTKNPNVQKIAVHQPLKDLFGLVAVTNAEKVILDRVDIDEKEGTPVLIERTEQEADLMANELRSLIGTLPGLAVFIDEVHHAATDDKKLRAVVNHWMESHQLNSVIGFSGTPYLQKAEKIEVAENLTIANPEIANIVYYYPLADGIGNFLKKPTVKIADGMDRLQIVENGIREFFAQFKDTVYPDGTCAKLGIYCGDIETLELQIYPLAERLANEFGLNPAEAILRFHRGNKDYPMPEDAELRFASLDKSISKDRIVLLVQIGKEGWDCRSLTGIILSQEGDCPTNMVLQTSCRCLRQVRRGVPEPALIYLNKGNADILNTQLVQQHHISLQEFQSGSSIPTVELKRYDRTAFLKLPKLDFFQLRVQYLTQIITEERNIKSELVQAVNEDMRKVTLTHIAETKDSLKIIETNADFRESGTDHADFNCWLYEIVKQGFNAVSMDTLKPYESILHSLFQKITYQKDGYRYFTSQYDRAEVNANIRKAFYVKRDFEIKEELVPENASLLKVDAFAPSVLTAQEERFIPKQEMVEKIVQDDAGKLKIDAEKQKIIDQLIAIGQTKMADQLKAEYSSHPAKDKTFHYLPYKTDSSFERIFLDEVLTLAEVKKFGLEVYYNGDGDLTEFRIRCFKKAGRHWQSIGLYTPDFLILQRKDGKIHKAIIVETKGALYARDPNFKDRRDFMETAFIQKNNEAFGYRRFEYLYLEDSLSDKERIGRTSEAISEFFQANP